MVSSPFLSAGCPTRSNPALFDSSPDLLYLMSVTYNDYATSEILPFPSGLSESVVGKVRCMKQTDLKPSSSFGSGRVRRFEPSGGTASITQITTFCPDVIGPGPTHVYLIDGDVPIVVDAGIPTHLAKAFFYRWRNQPMPPDVEGLPLDCSEQELREGLKLAGRSVEEIDLLAITHGHLDHFMMGSLFTGNGKTKVASHILDTPAICNPWGLLNMWVSRQKQMAATGMPPAKPPKGLSGTDGLRVFDHDALGVSLKVDNPIFEDGPLTIDGSAVDGIEVRHLPGHSPGSIGLLIGGEDRGEKVLICGDVLLDPITPLPDDLLVYLQTLEELSRLEDVAVVLPAHGQEFRDLRGRIAFLKEHHRNRLKLTYQACSLPKCVWDIATMKDYFETYVAPEKFNFLAGLEALVHVEILSMVEGVKRVEIRGEVHYFQNSGEPFDLVYDRVTELVKDTNVRTLLRY